MNKLKFKLRNIDGETKYYAIYYATNNAHLGYLTSHNRPFGWMWSTDHPVTLNADSMKEILNKLKCLNHKPKKTAPPKGFFKCLGCGVLVKIKDGVDYEEQCTCPNHECDGQLFCNQFKGWE